jgi:hypothetical protein
MAKPMFDADAMIGMFESATAKQGEQLKEAVSRATLAALQGRELTLKNIRGTLKAVSEAASAGVARNLGVSAQGLDAEGLLEKAVAGMDDALLKAVDANRVALQTLVAQGADLREKHLKKAIDELDRFEDTMFATFRKTAEGAGAPLAAAWGGVLEKMQAGGTLTGVQVAGTVQQLSDQVQTTIRSSRAASLRAAQVLAESYAAMVSGVLTGMSEALQSGRGGAPVAKAAPRGPSKKG